MVLFQDKLDLIYKELKSFLNEKKLISRLELRLKIKDLLLKQNFTPEDEKIFEAEYGYTPLQSIFLTITSGIPTSIQIPILHEKLEYKQVLFYHSHTYKIPNDTLKKAFNEFCKMQTNLLRIIVLKILIQSSYTVQETTTNPVIAQKNKTIIKFSVFCSILHLLDEINSFKLTSNDVLIIPPGTSIGPFIQFYQTYSNDILLSEATVWLVDTENKTLSTFIGVPKDKNLLQFFTKSQLATQIERRWRPAISEDF